jgi:hypothetical protein
MRISVLLLFSPTMICDGLTWYVIQNAVAMTAIPNATRQGNIRMRMSASAALLFSIQAS